jgi:hypothetical protein
MKTNEVALYGFVSFAYSAESMGLIFVNIIE